MSRYRRVDGTAPPPALPEVPASLQAQLDDLKRREAAAAPAPATSGPFTSTICGRCYTPSAYPYTATTSGTDSNTIGPMLGPWPQV